MNAPSRWEPSDFRRYLASKRSVDDRALNRHVWQTLAQELASYQKRPLRVLEAGAGIGTMFERMVDWGLLTHAEYTALDAEQENITCALQSLTKWAAQRGFMVEQPLSNRLNFVKEGWHLQVDLETTDLFDFIAQETGRRRWDVLVAHAFLDLIDVPTTLSPLFSLSCPGGWFYFTINFDGATLLEPEIDLKIDSLIQSLYHRTMDERLVNHKASGDSRTGRHLFGHLRDAGAVILDAGASDWVVFSGPHGYTLDEAYFLHFVIQIIDDALTGHPELDPELFANWIAERHAQIERRELIYIAHQLDFVGRVGTQKVTNAD